MAAEPPLRAPAFESTPLQEAAVPIVDETPFSSGLTPTVISTLEEPEEEITLEEAQPQAEPEVSPEEETLPQAELEVGPEEEETPPQAEPEIIPEAVPDHVEPSPPPSADLGPLAVFETRYRLGDDDFDANFSIEPEGDFVGECGIGISDVLEANEAQHVDAFELWLFDKGDIRTVSKVLTTG